MIPCRLLMLVFYLGVTLPVIAQDEFFLAEDRDLYSQSFYQVIAYEEDIYSIGVTVCPTGECTVLAKYDMAGKELFFVTLDSIDSNSFNNMAIRNDTIIFTSLPKYETGAMTFRYTLDGKRIDSWIVHKSAPDSLLNKVWPIDVLYLDDYYFIGISESYDDIRSQKYVYKVDYEGNVLYDLKLESKFRNNVLDILALKNGNIFVSMVYREVDGLCEIDFILQDDLPNTMMFYEIDPETMEVLHSKDQICGYSANGVGFSSMVMPSGNIIRPKFAELENDPSSRWVRVDEYDAATWEVVDYYDYPLIKYDVMQFTAYGVSNHRPYISKDSTHYYVVAVEAYPPITPEPERSRFINIYIEKRDLSHNLIWNRTISDPNVHKRLLMGRMAESEDKLIICGLVHPELFTAGTQDYALMTLDKNGCFNGDCSDTIYLNGPLVSITEIIIEKEPLSVYPNPTTGILTIKSEHQVSRIEVYDLNYRKIYDEQYDVSLKEYTMDLSPYDNGIYIIRSTTIDGILTNKVVKI